MHKLQRSWVRSQHPSAQWNLRGGRWSSAEYCKNKKKKIPPKNILKKKIFLTHSWSFPFLFKTCQHWNTGMCHERRVSSRFSYELGEVCSNTLFWLALTFKAMCTFFILFESIFLSWSTSLATVPAGFSPVSKRVKLLMLYNSFDRCSGSGSGGSVIDYPPRSGCRSVLSDPDPCNLSKIQILYFLWLTTVPI